MDTNYSLADIAAATGGNRNNDGFGDSNGWWIILFLLICGCSSEWGSDERFCYDRHAGSRI